MPAIFFALISLFGWATGDVLGTLASRRIGAYLRSFWNYLFGIILFAFYIPFALNDFFRISPNLLVLNILLAVILVFSFLSFNYALKIGNSSLVGTIAGAFTSLVVIFSIIFLGERISLEQSLAIIVIFLGLILSSLNFADLRKRKWLSDKGILFALISMLGWGIYFTFIKIPVTQIGWFWPHYISGIVGVLILLLLPMKGRFPEIPSWINLKIIILSEILIGAGEYSYNYGISIGQNSVVAPIAGSYPALFALLAYFVFKDKITKQQILGIITTLVGIVLLSVFSV